MLCAPFVPSSLGVLLLQRHPSRSTISLSTKLHINQYSFSSYNIPALFFIIYFLQLLDYSHTHFSNSESNHIIYLYMFIAITCGVHFCIERQPYNSDTRENRWRIKSKLTYHCSFIRKWILVCCVLHLYCHPSECSVCMLIHHSLPSAF